MAAAGASTSSMRAGASGRCDPVCLVHACGGVGAHPASPGRHGSGDPGRSGRVGWSDTGPWPRTAGTMADELHALLSAAGIPPPYIIIAGHSSGGLNARMFTARHPELVAGLVLIDASHEDQERRLGERGGGYWRPALRLQLRPLGWDADGGQLSPTGPRAGVGRAGDVTGAGRGGRRDELEQPAAAGKRQELLGFVPGGREVAAGAAGPGRFGRLPSLVLTSHRDWDWTGIVSVGKAGEERRQFYAAWWPMQQEMVALSEDSRHVVAERAGHHIHRHNPDFVIQQTCGFLGRVRDNSATSPVPAACEPGTRTDAAQGPALRSRIRLPNSPDRWQWRRRQQSAQAGWEQRLWIRGVPTVRPPCRWSSQVAAYWPRYPAPPGSRGTWTWRVEPPGRSRFP
jgi:pimeloyl-ACP methyl ester carboxylesterase